LMLLPCGPQFVRRPFHDVVAVVVRLAL
jgi:hypothetical protein